MLITKKKLYQNWIFILILMLTGLLSIGVIMIVSGTQLTNSTIDAFYEYNLNNEKKPLLLRLKTDWMKSNMKRKNRETT